MLATDDREEALEALPTVASSYTTAEAGTQQWIMYYFSALLKSSKTDINGVLNTRRESCTQGSRKPAVLIGRHRASPHHSEQAKQSQHVLVRTRKSQCHGVFRRLLTVFDSVSQ